MKTPKHSLRKVVSFLNNPDQDGGFWLPNIQRPFVWTEEQICRLFDSILREYPISTLLVWRTRSATRRRRFIDNFRQEQCQRLRDFYVPPDEKSKCLVLDGQQRLQSLFIGLKGSYEGRELHFDILSGDLAAPDDVKFRFAFLDAGKARFPWLKFKDIVYSSKDSYSTADIVIEGAGRDLSVEEKKKINRHVALVFKTFHTDDGIGYQELDSTEEADLYTEDDVVEVFIRANAGGTKLGKSDLLFSLLATDWDVAGDELEELLGELNRHGFAFTRDFVLKTCLTLLDKGARYEVAKFRDPAIREEIKSRWDDIGQAIAEVADFVQGKTFIRSDKVLSSYLVLIPLIYLRYRFPAAWKTAKGVEEYLLKCLLTGAFGGTPDQLIDSLVSSLKELQRFDLDELTGVIRNAGRSLQLTEDRLWKMGYGSAEIHVLFSLWYRSGGANYDPSYEGNLLQVDHIFPQSLLRKEKKENPKSGKWDLLRYPETERNQLANCQLLTQQENGFAAKCDDSPATWFAKKREHFAARDGEANADAKLIEYLQLHMIPADPELWRVERFDDFIAARKLLILRSSPI